MQEIPLSILYHMIGKIDWKLEKYYIQLLGLIHPLTFSIINSIYCRIQFLIQVVCVIFSFRIRININLKKLHTVRYINQNSLSIFLGLNFEVFIEHQYFTSEFISGSTLRMPSIIRIILVS